MGTFVTRSHVDMEELAFRLQREEDERTDVTARLPAFTDLAVIEVSACTN
jgi:hypothetical protein